MVINNSAISKTFISIIFLFLVFGFSDKVVFSKCTFQQIEIVATRQQLENAKIMRDLISDIPNNCSINSIEYLVVTKQGSKKVSVAKIDDDIQKHIYAKEAKSIYVSLLTDCKTLKTKQFKIIVKEEK